MLSALGSGAGLVTGMLVTMRRSLGNQENGALTARRDASAVAACLARWGLTPETASADAPAPSRHQLVIARSASGRRYAVKLAPAPGDEALGREAAVLLALAAHPHPGLPAFPTPLAFDPELAVLACAWLARCPTVHAHQRATGRWEPALAAAIGRGLGGLHRAGAAGPLARFATALGDRDREVAGVFLAPTPAFYARLSRAGIAMIGETQADAAAMAALQALVTGPVRRCLVHGDAKPANVLRATPAALRAAGLPATRRVTPVFLDWELAGRGDPARDVATLAANEVRAWLAPTAAAEALHQSTMQAWLRALIAGYRRGRAAAEDPWPVEPGFAARVVGWTGLMLLHHVFGATHFHARYDGPDAYVARYARDLLKFPDRWAPELFGAGPP